MYSIRILMLSKHINDNKYKLNKLSKFIQHLNYSNFKNESFCPRHIGSDDITINKMLTSLNLKTLDELVDKTVPKDIRLNRNLNIDEPMTEHEFLVYAKKIASENQIWRSYIGMGYYNCHIPTVIARNIFENPGWITQYTPYQAELSQGRLESLLNFQTMISDLTGLEISNASLLDEGTAGAEALTLCFRHNRRNRFFISNKVNPQTIFVIQTRASILGIEVEVGDILNTTLKTDNLMGIMIQYPDTEGTICDLQKVIQDAKNCGALVTCVTDLLALCLIKSPKDIGVDIALGNAQRFGIPLGFGGPHAAFIACLDKFKRNMPGRIIGISRDALGNEAFRLSLQTREQHIRQDKATSNICTAQALLANMNAFYAIYHGPEGLKNIAKRVHNYTILLAETLKNEGNEIKNELFFDTIKIKPKINLNLLKSNAEAKKINLRYFTDNEHVGISLDETVSENDFNDLLEIFDCSKKFKDCIQNIKIDDLNINLKNNNNFIRHDKYLQHPVYNNYHSESMITRYIKKLENKDYSLVHGMIPLGSCTMKLNATTELIPCSWPEFNAIHPFVPKSQVKGYLKMFIELEKLLCEITGFDGVSLQPNSGAQGEYAGLRTIMSYLKSIGQENRRICLIPTSAHGTNPASAIMAGMKIIKIEVSKDGGINSKQLEELASKYKNELACAMITYPSTTGVFDHKIREQCSIIHEYGGQVYLDGANMNAQVGLCRPADYGADVCHLNLHKTFCIPHGGGGPGMGPIAVKQHLIPYLPSHLIVDIDGVSRKNSFGSVSSAPWGSASILPISWSYIKMMGAEGLKKATQVAILNANYMMKKLEPYYKIVFVGQNGFCAHEFVMNADFKSTANVEAVDIAKRLQDYGFHSPTMSWPIHGTLMVEPTESENKEELDRLCDALISIRKEIKNIETGVWDKQNNPLKNAPHTQALCISSNWNKPYTREVAAYPSKYITPETKIWPTCARVDDTFGDRNLVCRWK